MVDSETGFPRPFGPYTLLSRVALGGMAEILLALEDSSTTRRFVTIKRIRAEHAQDPDYIDFFLSEGRVALRCDHPNLTRSFALGRAEGLHYLAMEFIRGHTLLDLIRASFHQEALLRPASCLEIGLRVAAALDHLHAMTDDEGQPMRVVHRDVTPQNIMIDAAGAIKLIDFGIARSAVQLHRTQAGTIKGKFSYMAPEQLESGAGLDHRGDLFSLGIVLHESLTSRSLFRGESDAETLDRVRHLEIPRIDLFRSDVPRALDSVVRKALERDVRKRFQSAGELYYALLEVGEHQGLVRPQGDLRDELLERCGDPPVAVLPSQAVVAVQQALNTPAGSSVASADPELQYFLARAALNLEQCRADEP